MLIGNWQTLTNIQSQKKVCPGLHVFDAGLFGALSWPMRHVCGVLDRLAAAGCIHTTTFVVRWVLFMQQHPRDYVLPTPQCAPYMQQCLLSHLLAFCLGYGSVSKLHRVVGLDLVHMRA